MVYLFNSPVLNAYGQWSFSGPLSVESVREILAGGFVSAVGHAGTAELLSELLAVACAFNRHDVTMRPGDSAIVFRLLMRLEEGRILSADELRLLPYELSLLTLQAGN